MALALEKTWQVVNIGVATGEGPSAQSGAGADDTANRQVWWEVKEALTGVASGAWTVAMSCGYDSGSWSYGAADYWVTAEDVRYKEVSGDQRSWIVLQQNGIKTGFQVCVELAARADATEDPQPIYVSPSGSFTGGDELGRPTASDEVNVQANDMMSTTATTMGANIFVSTDGQCTRWLNTFDGVVRQGWLFDKLKSQASASFLTSEGVYGCFTSANGSYEIDRNTNFYAQINGTHMLCRACAPGMGSLFRNQSEIRGPDSNGDYGAGECFIFPYGAGGGIIGQLYDFYAVSVLLSDGDYFAGGTSKEFVTARGYALGSDGSDIVFT